MKGKGKFTLNSFFVENDLLFYKSTNKVNKIIAFSLLSMSEYNYRIFENLKEILAKCYIKYFAIQINLDKEKEKEIMVVLNYEEQTKKQIIKLKNIVQKEFSNRIFELKMLRKNSLKNRFFSSIIGNISLNSTLIKDSKCMVVDHNEKIKRFFLYSIRLSKSDNNSNFLENLLRILNNFGVNGTITFNFAFNSNSKIIFNIYFFTFLNKEKENYDLEGRINEFYKEELFKELSLCKSTQVFRILWRLPMGNNFYLLESYYEVFSNKSASKIDKNQYILDLEKQLKENSILYHKINQIMFLIRNEYLFIVLDSVDYKFLLDIVKKYYSKYQIFALFLNKKDFEDILKVEKIKLLDKLKIFNAKDSPLDFKILN